MPYDSLHSTIVTRDTVRFVPNPPIANQTPSRLLWFVPFLFTFSFSPLKPPACCVTPPHFSGRKVLEARVGSFFYYGVSPRVKNELLKMNMRLFLGGGDSKENRIDTSFSAATATLNYTTYRYTVESYARCCLRTVSR